MLELHGAGSSVEHLVIDGSITPQPADLGVARIDFDSDDSTDFLLYTIDGDDDGGGKRWLVAGGVRFVVPWGSFELVGNTLRNFNDNAVLAEGAQDGENISPMIAPRISGNVITGGAAGQRAASAEGNVMYYAVSAVVSNNLVAGFRRGLSVNYATGLDVSGNQFDENGTGVEFTFGNDSIGPNAIDDNSIARNTTQGIKVRLVTGLHITNNEVNKNGSDPDYEGGVLVEDSESISVMWNELNKNSGFGVTLSGAGQCTVESNEANFNGGAGIVLFNGAHENQINDNHAQQNSVGIVAGIAGSGEFPSDNSIAGNTFRRNLWYDVLDQDPSCNDFWDANSFDTVLSAADDCVQ